MIEHLKIILVCVVAAVFYGIAHDQITARICVEYFTIFHPPVFATQSPTLLALGWGVIATWWVGLFLGLLLTVASRSGSRPKLSAAELIAPIAELLLVMAVCALIAGLAGFYLSNRGLVKVPEWVASPLLQTSHARFMADWFAHIASYASGLIGGIVLCVLQYRRRARSASLSTSS